MLRIYIGFQATKFYCFPPLKPPLPPPPHFYCFSLLLLLLISIVFPPPPFPHFYCFSSSSSSSFMTSYCKTDNLYQFMVIQNLPLISHTRANMAGDRRLLVHLFFHNSTTTTTPNALFA